MILLRIELEIIQPMIWREVVVPISTPLDVLHMIIQGAMAWQNYHLHEFEISEQRYELPDEESEPWDGYEPRKDERQFLLGDLVGQGDEFTYVYDFGDNWKHKITVLEKDPVSGSPDTVFPCCLAGERACPPEDSGGIYSYEEFASSLTNPKHPEHEDNRRWAGEFDPEVFSVSQANAFVGAMYVWGLEKRMSSLLRH